MKKIFFYLIEIDKKFLYPGALIIFGIWSFLLGQDRSYDIQNYHFYNGFAFLNNKYPLDFSPAGVQTYLNPILDTLYYFLNTNLNPKLFGFLMGVIHGINFILLYEIIENSIPNIKKNIYRLIAFASILSCNFLASLGSSGGDNITAIFVLSSLLLIINVFEDFRNPSFLSKLKILCSGLLIGTAASLKLTNAIYVPAIFISILFSTKAHYNVKLHSFILIGFGCLLGFLIFGAFWHLKIWHMFENPIFPFFSNFFKNPITNYINPTSSWSPNNFIEFFLWPYIFTFNYQRVSEGNFHQIIWPIFYSLSLYFLVINIFMKKSSRVNLTSKELFLLVFIITSFFLWAKIFSVIRYIVALELLLPLAIFILLSKIIDGKKRVFMYVKYLCGLSIFVTLFGGYGTWGHTSWRNPVMEVKLPPNISGSSNNVSVLILGGSPITWIATQFPSDIAFAKLVFKSDDIVKQKFISRGGDIYALFSGFYNWREGNVKKWTIFFDHLRLTHTNQGCQFIESLIDFTHFRGELAYQTTNSKSKLCFIQLKESDYIEPNLGNNFFIDSAYKELVSHGFSLEKSSCTLYDARFGNQPWPYIWCKVTLN